MRVDDNSHCVRKLSTEQKDTFELLTALHNIGASAEEHVSGCTRNYPGVTVFSTLTF